MGGEYSDLNTIQIPLADVRMFIVDLMRDGHTTYPLGDFLQELHIIYHDKHDDEQSLVPLDKE